MRIRKLELHGFKSFPDRTALVFGEGISCVVGPNGCGKSNIVDALRWCIGEQSARSLRGSEMSDVIFAGSQVRKPVGFAEVSLTLTSEGGEPFPGEFAQFTEISVGRRLHRTGASEYFVNQRRVRRRDVQDLFLDTGVGNNLYSFIEQGRIGKIVHARPEDRRSLIDEAAGISRYKQRREEARSRLVATSAQLDRAADVADEMARRVRSLARQVLKAGRFRRARAQVRQDEIALSLARFIALSADRRTLRERLRSERTSLEAAQRAVARREVDLASRREEIEVVQAEVERRRDRVAELDAQLRELASASAFAEQRLRELAEREEREREARSAAEQAQQRAREASDLAQAEATQARERGVASSEALASAAEGDERARAAQTGARAADREASAALVTARSRVERLSDERERLDEAVAALPARAQDLADRKTGAERALEEATEAAEAAADRAERAALDNASERSRREVCEAAVERAAAQEREALAAQRRAEDALATLRAQEREAVAELEAVAREAEDARRQAEAGVSAVEERAARDVRDAAAREQDALRAAAERDLRRARERADAWISALEARAGARVRAARVAADAARAEHERAYAEQIATSDTDRSATIERAVAQARREAEPVVQAAAERAAAAALRVTEARAVLAAARDRARSTERALAEAQIRLDRAQADLRALAEGDRGARAVREALPDAARLLDVLDDATRAAPWLVSALGPWLGAPVVHDAEQVHVAARAAADHGPTPILLRPSGTLDAESALSGTVVVDDLASALQHARDRGTAAVVAGTGARVEPDGRVALGVRDNEGQALVDLEAAVDEATRRAERAQTERDASAAALDEAERALAAAESESEATSAARREAEHARAQAVEKARVAAQATHAQARQALQRDHERRGEQLRAEAAAALERLRAQHEAARSAALDVRRRALDDLTTHAEAEDDAARARAAQDEALARSQARAAAEQDIEQRLAFEDEARQQVRNRIDAQDRVVREATEPADAARATTEAAREALAAARAELDSAVETQGERALFAARAEATAVAARESRDRAARDLQAAIDALSAEQERAQALTTERAELGRALEVGQASLDAAEASAQAAAQALRAAESEAEQAATTLAQARIEAATWQERSRAADQAIASAAARRDDAEERARAATEAIEEIERSRAQVKEDRDAAQERATACQVERDEAWDHLMRERERITGLRDGLTTAESDLRERLTQVADQGRAVEQLRGEVETARAGIDTLHQRIDARYQVRLPGLLDQLDAHGRLLLEPDPLAAETLEVDGVILEPVEPITLTARALADETHVAQWLERLERGRAELERLGDVNLAAYDEYRDVHTRHADLEAQRADLEASVEHIRSAIAKMNRTCRQRFRDTFDLVNQHFQDLYPSLVGGGSARLSLTDEEDLLETGVDIFVQPPGKRLQNLTLLSGGEKAMTAIALILSLFRVKPSPFCVLDEVDAPLDEANGSRFNQALLDMSEASQFIVISHNRRTMEVASTLYGITMPDPGVSRVVSVQLDDGPSRRVR